MKIRWFEDAISDLIALHQYIAHDKPIAAQQIAKRIRQSVSKLAEHPLLGRPGRIETTREFVITNTPYIVTYRIKNDVIEILRVLHGAMKWPEQL